MIFLGPSPSKNEHRTIVFYCLRVGNLQYRYTHSRNGKAAKLEAIAWGHDKHAYFLEVPEELNAFMDTNVDAEEDALQRARIKASLKEHKLSIISGGIAVVAAIVLPIVIVKRKWKKAADGVENEGENIEFAPPPDRK